MKRLCLIFAVAVLAIPLSFVTAAWAAVTEQVLFNFHGGAYGNVPGFFVRDASGNIYGTLGEGGNTTCTGGCGLVYKLTPSNGHYVESIIHAFTGGNDGASPSGILMDANGNLFVSAPYGGVTKCLHGCGAIVEFSPIKAGGYKMTVLFDFAGGIGGNLPQLTMMDAQGNLYGFANAGTSGEVFQLSSSGDTWTKKALYIFKGGTDGVAGFPYVIDASGNIYGVAGRGGITNSNCSSGCGVVFELTPTVSGMWTESVLYSFTGTPDGANPNTLLTDGNGNFFGTTENGGTGTNAKCGNFTPFGCGTLFELSPSSGGYTETVLHDFNAVLDGYIPDALVMDGSGNLFEASFSGGVGGSGVALEFTLGSDGIWEYTNLHSFADGKGGGIPFELLLDSSGNVFGGTAIGGSQNFGTLFELSRTATKASDSHAQN